MTLLKIVNSEATDMLQTKLDTVLNGSLSAGQTRRVIDKWCLSSILVNMGRLYVVTQQWCCILIRRTGPQLSQHGLIGFHCMVADSESDVHALHNDASFWEASVKRVLLAWAQPADQISVWGSCFCTSKLVWSSQSALLRIYWVWEENTMQALCPFLCMPQQSLCATVTDKLDSLAPMRELTRIRLSELTPEECCCSHLD